MINIDSIKNYLTSSPPLEKVVLRVKDETLYAISLKDTKFFERIQAWFGYGPLSLANIANFIAQTSQTIKESKELSSSQKKDFFEKLNKKISAYNQHHSLQKVSQIALASLVDASFAFGHKDATYQTEGPEIDDVAYANPIIKFGYVADGTGHGNSMMAAVLNRIFSKFNQDYSLAFNQASLESEEDYKEFVIEQLTILGDAIHNEPEEVCKDDPKRPGLTKMNDPTLKPAFSFAQVATLGEKRALISAHFSDTMILIKKSDGSFDTRLTKKITDSGLGERTYKIANCISVTEVNPGDVIYGFSDGIGEFLNMEECQAIILSNQDPGMLLQELKEKIIENGKNFVQDPDNRERENTTTSANQQRRTKFHLANDPHFYDDISAFRLLVT